jgi:hypothetical protein
MSTSNIIFRKTLGTSSRSQSKVGRTPVEKESRQINHLNSQNVVELDNNVSILIF